MMERALVLLLAKNEGFIERLHSSKYGIYIFLSILKYCSEK